MLYLLFFTLSLIVVAGTVLALCAMLLRRTDSLRDLRYVAEVVRAWRRK
jgi:hypothetical protein